MLTEQMPAMDSCAATDSSQPVCLLVEKYYHPVYQRESCRNTTRYKEKADLFMIFKIKL